MEFTNQTFPESAISPTYGNFHKGSQTSLAGNSRFSAIPAFGTGYAKAGATAERTIRQANNTNNLSHRRNLS
ncbi:hypothetical protein [Novosphingobium sp.]|uniref:hypothetical protein n=1 Tax=Novosphingobium sp. TaxID=1874826 RepID=UPI0038B7BFA5